MLGSSVVPDFDETKNTVVAGATRSSMALTCWGSVESSTWSRGNPGVGAKVAASTSGQRLDPPMPRTTASVNPSLRTISASSRKRWAFAA